MKNSSRIMWLLLTVSVVATDYLFATVSYSKQEPLVIGVFPRRNATVTYSSFKPLANYLSAKLNREVKLLTTKNFTTFWKNVENGRYDLVHYNQYHYIVSSRKFGYKVILSNEEFGKSTISSAISVRKDSGISSVKQLKDKKIVFGGGRQAMMSYIYAIYLLEQAGLKPGDYTEAFAKNPPNALFSTYYKQSDAAGTGDVVLQLPLVKKQISVNALKPLIVGNRLPHLPWAVKSTMDAKTAATIQSLMAGLKNNPAGRTILKKARLTAFNVSNDTDYDPFRVILKKMKYKSE